MHLMDADEAYREKAKRELYKNATRYIELIVEATPQETAAIWPLTSHLKNLRNKTNKTCETLLEK